MTRHRLSASSRLSNCYLLHWERHLYVKYVTLVVTDNNKIPYPLLPNPTMFSINGLTMSSTPTVHPTPSSGIAMSHHFQRMSPFRVASHIQLNVYPEWPDLQVHRGCVRQSADDYGNEELHDHSADSDLQIRFEPHLYDQHSCTRVRRLRRDDDSKGNCHGRSAYPPLSLTFTLEHQNPEMLTFPVQERHVHVC